MQLPQPYQWAYSHNVFSQGNPRQTTPCSNTSKHNTTNDDHDLQGQKST